MPRVAWVLNLDVELELADPGYRRSPRMRRLIEELAPRFLAGFDDEIEPVFPWAPRPLRDIDEGKTWCPTPAALRVLAACGVEPPEAPPEAVLRRVLSRGFVTQLGRGLPGAVFTRELAEVEAKIAQACDSGRWLLKRSYGFSGRERKLVARGELAPAARRWVEASLEHGLWIEPWVDIVLELGLHGWVTRAGDVELGVPLVQVCDGGAWVESRPVTDELRAGERLELLAAAVESGALLAEAGYFGPFGVDAYRWRGSDQSERFQPLGELNARYGMAFGIGMGQRRD